MKPFKKAAIIGTGLIGGSLALAIKKRRLAKEVVGVSRHARNIALAKRRGVIDKGSVSLEVIRDADLVIFAAPVDVIKKLAPKAAKFLNKNCIVTDVGSTKQEIVSCLEKIFPLFVGSHPLAGSEKRSVANAQMDLFRNSLCILTPTRKTNRKALRALNIFWKKVGANTEFLSPDAHDTVLGFVSHLPHIAAFSLIEAVPKNYLRFAASGLKDTTRIAASDSELWAQIFLSNRRNLSAAIAILEKNITKIKKALRRNNIKQLSRILKEAKAKREILA